MESDSRFKISGLTTRQKKDRAESMPNNTGWVMSPNGQSIVRGEIADTPEAKAASDALGVKQEAWERSLDPTRKNSNFLAQIGNSLGIKPLSETLTLQNVLNAPAHALNSVSRATGGSGNTMTDLGIGGFTNSLFSGTDQQALRDRLLATAAVLGGNALMGSAGTAGATGTAGASTVGAAEAAGGSGLFSQINDWANNASSATGGSGNVGTDLQNGVNNNLGQLLAGAGGIYNSYQQGQAANDIAQQQMNLQRPYYDAGTAALGKMGQGVSAYQQDPYNAWLQEQGNQGIQRSAAAKGMLGSGNVLAELAKYNQGMAGKGYQDWFGNQATIAGYGSPAAANMGNAYAGGRQGSADATSGMTGSLAEMFNNIYNNPNKGGVSNTGVMGGGSQPWQTPGINPYVTTDYSQWWPKSA